MIGLLGGAVIDASVGIKLFVAEPLSDRAETLFARLAASPPARLFVPDLFFIECANVLWKHVRRFGYPAADAQSSIAALAQLNVGHVATAELAADALDIALAAGMTAYDACYLALARRLAAPLVTADAALVRKLTAAGANVVWLGAL